MKYYMNNPCEIVREISDDFSEVKVYKTFDDEMCGSNWCVGCLAGHTDGTANHHTCDQYDEVIDALRDAESSIIVIVENRLLADEPVEFKAWQRARSDLSQMKKNRDDARDDLWKAQSKKQDIKRQISALNKEYEDLNNSLKPKRDIRNRLDNDIYRLQKSVSKLTSIEVAQGVTVNISIDELKRLIKNDLKMGWLEQDGVDNWEWYGKSFPDYDEVNELVLDVLGNYTVSLK